MAETDSTTITVKNVESGATVTAYKIVKPEYDNGYLKGYKAVEGVTVADPSNPTLAEINAVDITNLDPIAIPEADGIYSKELPIGEYLIVVTPKTGSTVTYQRMVASVYYADDANNTITGGTADAATSWTVEGSDPVAKSTKENLTKIIQNNSDNDKKEDKGDDHQTNEEITFKVTATIPTFGPEYSAADAKVVYKVQDTLDAGLTYLGNLEVKVAGTAVPSDAYVATPTESAIAGGGFSFQFTKAFILAHGNDALEITYKAKLNENASSSFDPNNNTVTVSYNNDPQFDDETHMNKEEDKTHHYTFEIDGEITGFEGSKEKGSSEVIKVDEATGKTEKISSSTWETDTTYSAAHALNGAKFAIFKANEAGTAAVGDALQEVTTANEGRMNFKGLDAGKYVIVETAPPAGYTLDSTPVPVEINSVINDEGVLESYTITVGGASTTYTANYEGETVVVDRGTNSETRLIKNTTNPELPSTGGIGTYVFTIAGVAIMAVAAGLLIVRRKKA